MTLKMEIENVTEFPKHFERSLNGVFEVACVWFIGNGKTTILGLLGMGGLIM